MTGDASSGIAGDLRGVSPSLGRRGARRTCASRQKSSTGPSTWRIEKPRSGSFRPVRQPISHEDRGAL